MKHNKLRFHKLNCTTCTGCVQNEMRLCELKVKTKLYNLEEYKILGCETTSAVHLLSYRICRYRTSHVSSPLFSKSVRGFLGGPTNSFFKKCNCLDLVSIICTIILDPYCGMGTVCCEGKDEREYRHVFKNRTVTISYSSIY